MTRTLSLWSFVLALGFVLTSSPILFASVLLTASEDAATIAAADDGDKKEERKKDEKKEEKKEEKKPDAPQGGGKKDENKGGDKPADVKKDEPKPAELPKVEPPQQPAPQQPAPQQPAPQQPAPQQPAPQQPAPQQPARPTLETLDIGTAPIWIGIKLAGQFESAAAAVIRLKAKSFTAFELVEVVPHGTAVRRGDTLIRFSDKKYQEALAEQTRVFHLSEITLRESELSLAALRARQPLRFEEMEISKKEADEDFAYYNEYERDLVVKLNEFQRRSSDVKVEASREELRQLERMYEADDLVEDTEEFILKRTRFQVEAAEFDYKSNQETLRRMLETILPRRERSVVLQKKLAEIESQRVHTAFPFLEKQAEIQVDRARQAHQTLVENRDKFLADEKWLTIKAPSDGVVYYGEFDNGKWQGGAVVQTSLKIGEPVKNDQVLMTIVEPRPTQFRAVVPEQELHWMEPDMAGRVAPKAFPSERYAVRLVDLPPYPAASGEYVARFTVRNAAKSTLVPGMTGSAEFVVYNNKEAVLVPNTAMKTEMLENDSHNHRYVWIVEAKGTTMTVAKTKVCVGVTVGDKTEVLSGLRKGQQILKDPPAK